MSRRAGLLLAGLFAGARVLAAEGDDAPPTAPFHPDIHFSSADVEVDGVVLFRVFGVPAFPAAERAAAIARRIEAVAADPSFDPEELRTVEAELGTVVMARDSSVMTVSDVDAQLAGVGRKAIASLVTTRMRSAIQSWRAARTAESLESSVMRALAATAIFGVVTALILWLARRTREWLVRRYSARIKSVGIQAFEIMRGERIFKVAQQAAGTLVTLTMLLMVLGYVGYVLGLFPWTRGASVKLAGYALDPLKVMGRGLLDELPNLVFLVVLIVVTRWLLKIVHLFFKAIERADVTISGFDTDWAEPTYKIVRFLAIVFALVVAYPYIPGSSSDAFKGITFFIGVVFSLGSSSIITNILAGYMNTYRRAYRIGDRVRIGDVVGDVVEQRLQVTHLKTVKNEEVTVPNSMILAREVVNYSSLARTDGLILHTAVRIGYQTPWRQVEAMLLEAARRTPGLMAEHEPFVRQKELGEFAILYEVNVYCDDARKMYPLHTALRRNLLDVFNEYGVQIMTPAYEGDPELPQIVPKERWFASPASPPSP